MEEMNSRCFCKDDQIPTNVVVFPWGPGNQQSWVTVDQLEGATGALWPPASACQKSTWKLRKAAKETTGTQALRDLATQDHIDYIQADPEQPPFLGQAAA